MKGEAKKLVWFIDGSSKRFVIPVYQRNYDWKTEHCKQLFDDLIKLIKSKRKNHFFGSIVSVFNPDGGNLEFLIIDGQQRMTTVSLLLLAMCNLLKNGEVISEKDYLGQKIYEDYLVDKFQPYETRIKLKPIKNDQLAFGKLFDDDEEYIQSSNITINYKYFLERIRKQEITIDQLYDAVGKLEIIDITLNPNDDNPQLIFESLNSTGLDLSEGDKIRNYILMGLPSKEQDLYYTKYWNPIEIKTAYDVSSFIRDYLSVKLQDTPSMKKIYFKFKDYFESDIFSDIESMLKDIIKYAKRFEILIKANSNHLILDECIRRLNRLETTITRPFFLEVLREHEEGNLSIEDVTVIFGIIESYIFRRSICDLPNNALNKIFLLLHKDIIRLERNSDNYVEKLKFILKNKKEKARYPDNIDFLESLEQKNIYSLPAKNKSYLFERLENGNSMESKNIYKMLDDGTCSIEHIMPQHLTPVWNKELGDDYESIHNTWLHRLANLSLTAYNSKYSNRPFVEKRDMEYGFKDSGFKMNQYISHKDRWGLLELVERNAKLANLAKTLWTNADTEYLPPENPFDEYTLDDDFTFTGKVLAKFSYKRIEQPASSWVDMYQKVLIMLHQEDKTVLNKLADSDADGMDLALHVSRTESTFNKAGMIDENIFVWTNTNTQYKINLLKKFFNLFGVDGSDLVLYLKDGEESPEDMLTREDIRIRYWSKALQVIREKTGIFLNVNTSKDNWISGATGYGGIVYSCVANMDSARVELYIGTASADTNKIIYDYLFEHKNEIESIFNGKLIWTRMNDKIASRIYLVLDDVSISNENDWDRMSSFHAETCNRLKNAISNILEKAVEFSK